MTEPHPYCAVTVVIIPLTEHGKPEVEHTVTLSGIGKPIAASDEVTVTWLPDRDTGTRFVINGPQGFM